MYAKLNKRSREISKKPDSKGILQEFFSWRKSKQNTFRVLIDQGVHLKEKTIYLDDIALLKEHYKRVGTDCSKTNVSTETTELQKEGFLIKKNNGYKRPITFSFTSRGKRLAFLLIKLQRQYQNRDKNSVKKSINIKNSTCRRACASVKRDIYQFKRRNMYNAILTQTQKVLQVTTRGMANLLQFDDSALCALLKEKDLHRKNSFKMAKEFCRVHMLGRGLFPDIDIVYRTWRKIDEENNGVRMPLFCLKQTYCDFKHKLLEGARWIFRKGTRDLPFSDPFSKFFKEKKKLRQKESFVYVSGSQNTKEQRDLQKESLTWKVVKTDYRSRLPTATTLPVCPLA